MYQMSAETDKFHSWAKLAQKGCFQPKTCKEHRHRVLHIRISLGSKIFPEQTNLDFWTKYAPRREFPA